MGGWVVVGRIGKLIKHASIQVTDVPVSGQKTTRPMENANTTAKIEQNRGTQHTERGDQRNKMQLSTLKYYRKTKKEQPNNRIICMRLNQK